MTEVEVHQSTLDDSLQKEIQELKGKIAEFCESVSLPNITLRICTVKTL